MSLIRIFDMEGFSDLMLIVGMVLAILSVFLLGYIVYSISKSKKDLKTEYQNKRYVYPTASAGSDKSDSKAIAESVDVRYNEFRSKNGHVLDAYNYDHYIVDGDSMQYCGIHDKDLLFVKKGFALSDLKPFPTILVLSKRDSCIDKPKYKVRRAWACCNIKEDDLKRILASIMEPQNFKSIRDIEYYDGDQALIDDFFNVRLKRYYEKYINTGDVQKRNEEIVISTTFHTDEKKVRFSIHPVSLIMGVVEESFTIS